MILTGNFDSFVTGDKFKSFRIVMHTCNEETRLSGDPVCSSDTDIDKWIKTKKAKIFIIDKKIKMKDFK